MMRIERVAIVGSCAALLAFPCSFRPGARTSVQAPIAVSPKPAGTLPILPTISD